MQQAEIHVLTEIEQLKAISEPLRARILTELCREEQTTKQVAERLGEKPTKLYHHVEQLEKAGLIRMTRTQPNRGTTEKYYLGVAKRFEVGKSLLGGSAEDALGTMIDTLLDQVRNECHRLAAGDKELTEVLEEEGLISFVELNADAATAERYLIRLRELLEELGQLPESDGEAPDRRFRLMFAYYPLDRFPD